MPDRYAAPCISLLDLSFLFGQAEMGALRGRKRLSAFIYKGIAENEYTVRLSSGWIISVRGIAAAAYAEEYSWQGVTITRDGLAEPLVFIPPAQQSEPHLATVYQTSPASPSPLAAR